MSYKICCIVETPPPPPGGFLSQYAWVLTSHTRYNRYMKIFPYQNMKIMSLNMQDTELFEFAVGTIKGKQF